MREVGGSACRHFSFFSFFLYLFISFFLLLSLVQCCVLVVLLVWQGLSSRPSVKKEIPQAWFDDPPSFEGQQYRGQGNEGLAEILQGQSVWEGTGHSPEQADDNSGPVTRGLRDNNDSGA